MEKAASGFGAVQLDKNCGGKPLRIAGMSVGSGSEHMLIRLLATHFLKATSLEIVSTVGLDNGGTDLELVGMYPACSSMFSPAT